MSDENYVQESLHLQVVLLVKATKFVKVTKILPDIVFCPINVLLFICLL